MSAIEKPSAPNLRATAAPRPGPAPMIAMVGMAVPFRRVCLVDHSPIPVEHAASVARWRAEHELDLDSDSALGQRRGVGKTLPYGCLPGILAFPARVARRSTANHTHDRQRGTPVALGSNGAVGRRVGRYNVALRRAAVHVQRLPAMVPAPGEVGVGGESLPTSGDLPSAARCCDVLHSPSAGAHRYPVAGPLTGSPWRDRTHDRDEASNVDHSWTTTPKTLPPRREKGPLTCCLTSSGGITQICDRGLRCRTSPQVSGPCIGIRIPLALIT